MGEVNFYSTDHLSKIKSYLELAAKPVVVLSTSFFRQYHCVDSGCGACCHKIVLEFVEGSSRWDHFKELHPQFVDRFKRVEISDRIIVYVDNQKEHKDKFCRYLDLENGRCTIHTTIPFPCQFVLSKFIDNQSRNRSILTTTYYGRGWSFLRVDRQSKGAMCKVEGFSYEKLLIDIQLLKELRYYSILLEIETKLPSIISYLEANLHRFAQGNIPRVNIEFRQKNTL